jgi:hypothetical protein
MKQKNNSRFFGFFLSFTLLIAPLPLLAIAENIVENLADIEIEAISYQDDTYVYLGKELSDVYRIVSAIKDLDDNDDSSLYKLHKHIENGFYIGQTESVEEALWYAEQVLERVSKEKYNDSLQQLMIDFELLMHKFANGELNISCQSLTNSSLHTIEKSGNQCANVVVGGLETVVINKNVDILGKLLVKKHIHTKQGLHVEGSLQVDESARFKEKVSIKKFLSVPNACIGNLSVGDLTVQSLNITSCFDTLCVNNLSINNLSVGDLVVASCMDNLCVNNLSVGDLAVASCIENLCVDNLSVGDLVVASCLDSLCVHNLVALDTLSAGDTALESLTITGIPPAFSPLRTFRTPLGGLTVAGPVTLTVLTSAGVVHNDAIGNLSSSLIVDADITAATITNDKLATVSSAAMPNNLVTYDGSGNFTANMITIAGTVTNPTDVATKAYVDAQVSGGGGTNLNMPNTVVKRDNTGSFAAQVISMTDAVMSNSATITPFNTPGVIHNDATGLLSSSLIVDADITAATITNDKLATVSSTGTPGSLVVYDGAGHFTASGISITGTPINPTDAATVAYVNSVAGTGLVVKTPAVVVGTTDIGVPAGLQTIDGVTLTTNNRVLLVGQINPVQNGLWLAQSGNWTRPADFASGTQAQEAYVLILSGNTNGGSSWLCSTPNAIIDTNPIVFAEFSLPSQTNGANIGAGTGLVFANKTGTVLNFRSFIASNHITITNNPNDITLGTDATNANTAGTIVARDGSNNFAAGTITANLVGNVTGNLTGNVTGVASGNFPFTGGTLTGNLTLPAGTAAIPSLQFTGSTGTGLSAATANTLSFDSSGVEQMKINSSGVTVDGLTPAGVVHNSAAGLLSTSLIVNADISATAAITDSKLATIATAGKVANSATTATTANTPNTIVLRDGSGNFTTHMITITGTTTNSTDVATKAYVDSVVTTGLVAKTPAIVVSTSNVALTGLQTIDGVTLVDSNRVLLVGQTNPVQNGLWLAHAGAWTRPADFATGTQAGQAYVLITSGTVNGGSSWLCNTPNAVIDTDPITFAEFSLPNQINGANVGAGTGLIFRDKTGVTLNFKSLIASNHIVITNNTSDITLATDAINTNSVNTIVARDASGNFSAGTITASLTGAASLNVLKAGDTMTGALQLPAGTAAAPSLKFTGSTTTGISAAVANTLSFDTNATERMNISATGGVTINGLNTVGVVHNSAAGLLSTSLIINADIAAAAAIANTKLAGNPSTTNTANTIVLRDGTGNFTTNMITIAGTTTNPTDVATKSYVDAQVGVGGTNINTPNTLVKRDGTGSFAAQVISMTDGVHSGNLILSTEPSSATAGNVLKGTSRFIHDFGINNTFVGLNAGNFTMTGSGGNSGFGINALTLNGTGSFNTAVGTGTLAANTSGANNTATGNNALAANTIGIDNTAVGFHALAVNTTGTDNTALGYNALAANATGTSFNTAVGSKSLAANTTGTNNVAVGYQSLAANTIGTHNVALGYNALAASTTATDNTAIGYNALAVNQTGAGFNTAVGSSALAANTTGIDNVAVGYRALATNTTGITNVAVGYIALAANTANSNTAVGSFALTANTTGTGNAALGASALVFNTIGAFNTALGSGTLGSNTTGNNNTAVGYNALLQNQIGTNNTAIGTNTLQSNTASNMVAVGSGALSANTTGTQNTAVGYNALTVNTVGANNTAIGYNALAANTTFGNVAVGSNALTANITGIANVAVGHQALAANIAGQGNVAVGYQALLVNKAASNTAVGVEALAGNTTGTNNTALGASALINNITGSSNTAVGFSVLSSSTSGNLNTAIGNSVFSTLTTGSGNIGIGNLAGSNCTGNESFNIYIASSGVAAENNTIRIGGATQNAAYIVGISGATTLASAVPVVVDTNNKLGTNGFYQTQTTTFTFQPMNASQNTIQGSPSLSIPVEMTRIGNVVMVKISGQRFSPTNSPTNFPVTYVSTTGVPAAFRPTVKELTTFQAFNDIIQNIASTATPLGGVTIDTNGIMVIWSQIYVLSSLWQDTNTGWYDIVMTYLV